MNAQIPIAGRVSLSPCQKLIPVLIIKYAPNKYVNNRKNEGGIILLY